MKRQARLRKRRNSDRSKRDRSTRYRPRVESLEHRRLLVAPTDLGAISGISFDDTNNNGVMNGGEVAISGATIELYRDSNNNGTFELGADARVGGNEITDANGRYTHDGLVADTYFVRQPAQTTTGGRSLSERISPPVIVSAADAQGQIITEIDTFDTTTHEVLDDTDDNTPVISILPTPDAIGGERKLIVNKTSVNGSIALSVNDPNLPNVMTFDSNQTGDGEFRVVWDGVGNNGVEIDDTGLNADLTGAEGISLNFGADAQGTAIVRLYSSDGVPGASRFSTASVTIPITAPGVTVTEFIPFSSFQVTGGSTGAADFTDVGAIELEIDGVPNINGTAELVGTLGNNGYHSEHRELRVR